MAVQLVGGHVNSTVNNPIEQVAHWRAGDTRPLCVFDSQRLAYTDKMTDAMAWSDIPTCKGSGIDVEYLMLRGIFMPPDVEQEAVDYYVDLLSKVRETPEWQDFMSKGAFNTTFMTGDEYKAWVGKTAERHENLMAEAVSSPVGELWLRDRLSPGSRSQVAQYHGRSGIKEDQRRSTDARSSAAWRGRADRRPGRHDLSDDGRGRRRHPHGGRRRGDGRQLRAGRRMVLHRSRSGYFPFYIGVLILLSSTITLLITLFGKILTAPPLSKASSSSVSSRSSSPASSS